MAYDAAMLLRWLLTEMAEGAFAHLVWSSFEVLCWLSGYDCRPLMPTRRMDEQCFDFASKETLSILILA